MMKNEKQLSKIIKNSNYVLYITLVFMSQEFFMNICHADGHQAKKKCIQFLSIHRCVSICVMGSGSLQYQISYSENP